MVCKYILFACCLCQRWAAMVSYIQNPVFHYMEDKHFLPYFQTAWHNMCIIYVNTDQTSHEGIRKGLNATLHQCQLYGMLREKLTPPVLSTNSFSFEQSRGKLWRHHTFAQKYFLQDSAPSCCPFTGRVRVSMKLIWQQKTLWIPISPGFSKCPCLLEELLWHLFCLLPKRHWLQFRGVTSEKVQCQIVLKTCPFHLLSGYCTQMNRGFLSLETFWSTKCRKSTGGTNSLRHQ